MCKQAALTIVSTYSWLTRVFSKVGVQYLCKSGEFRQSAASVQMNRQNDEYILLML